MCETASVINLSISYIAVTARTLIICVCFVKATVWVEFRFEKVPSCLCTKIVCLSHNSNGYYEYNYMRRISLSSLYLIVILVVCPSKSITWIINIPLCFSFPLLCVFYYHERTKIENISTNHKIVISSSFVTSSCLILCEIYYNRMYVYVYVYI